MRSNRFLIRPILTLLTVFLFTGCSPTGTGGEVEDSRLSVLATVAPIADIVRTIGGDLIAVEGIVPEGINSHTFEPAPSDARRLAGADLVFVNGLDLEEPTIRMAEANKGDDAEIIFLGEQTVTPDDYRFDFSFPEAGGSPNPHLWMNPIYALRYGEIIAETLSRRDPENAETYRANLESFATQIDELDRAIAETIETIPPDNRVLLTYHDSFAYFAPRYGMTVLGAVQPADFSEPSAQEVAGLIEQLRSADIPAVFGSEVFPSTVLDQIARESGVNFVDTLRDDDLPGEPGEPENSYIGMMIENVTTMAESLGGDPAPMLRLMDSQ